MYNQSTRAVSRRSRAGGRMAGQGQKKPGKEQTRLVQLFVCLILFLTVFIGKGVFPQKVQQVSGQLLELIGQNTDFRSAFARLGESLAEQDSVLGEIGDFCIEVFGAGDAQNITTGVQTDSSLEKEQQFLNSAPNQAALATHYLRLEQMPEEWLVPATEQTEPNKAEQQEEKTAAAPAVGTIIVQADYQGPELPEGYIMDQVSFGELETVTPVMGTLWSEYGYRDHPIDGEYKFHNGVDIGADQGREIGAFADGTVEYIGQNDAYGNYLQIDHGQGIKSFYAHCSQLCVRQGDVVTAGQKVAEVGSTGNATGPHLHFELKYNGTHIDPAYYIEYKTP